MTVDPEHSPARAASDTRYQLATELARLGTWTWDLVTDSASFDDRVAQLFGFDHDAPRLGADILATRVHDADRERVAAALSGAAEPHGEGRYWAEFRAVRPDGTERWVRAAGQMQFDQDAGAPPGADRRPVFLVGTLLDVTEEHERTAALHAALMAERAARLAVDAERERLTRIIAQIPAPVAVLEGRELRYRATSAAYKRIIGGRDVVGRPIRDAMRELSGREDAAKFFALLERVYETGEPFIGTGELARWDDNADGLLEDHLVDLVYAPLRGPDGDRVEGVIAVVLDVTARSHAETALRESEARFRTTADAAPVFIWTSGPDGGRDWFNRPWLTYTRSTMEAERGMGWTAHVHPDDLAHCLDMYDRALAAREPFTAEYRLRRHDGVYRHFLINAVPRYTEGNGTDRTFLGYIGTCADVSELREARSVASALVESVRDAFVAYDAEFRFTYVNEAAAELFRVTGETSAPLGRILWDAYPRLVGTPVEAAMRRAMNERVAVHFDTHDPVLRRWYAARVYPVATGGLTAVWTDVTPERRAREAAAFLADVSRVLGASLDYAVTLAVVAEAAVPRLGDWCAIDMVQHPAAREWPPTVERIAVVHQDPVMLALGEKLSAGYPTDWSAADGMAAVLRDGVPLFLPAITDEMVVAAAKDPEHLALLRALQFSSVLVVPLVARGLTLGALTLCMTESGRRYDDADRDLALEVAQRAALAVDNARLFRDAEQARADAERMRAEAEAANGAKTMFLSSMSHELRTPLHAIGGYADLLTLGVRGPITDVQRQDLERVRMANQHLLSLVNDILNFARVDAGQLEYRLADVELAVLVADVEPLIAPQFAAKEIAFDHDGCASDTPDRPHRVRADPEKLRQILLNLLTNAVKFTPAGGHVRLACSTDVAAGVVSVRVTDTGRGIPADQLERIFEPFVQVDRHRLNDSRQQGVGLGLAISRELARHMGGNLTAESTPGVGSTFTLTVPMA
ncbi:ATP-binding protein [Gemmatimonas sp.]|uniref:ATP-binding protein n=1 Tax=Gemmatimonas sp. TaxID=1962908 RepID=UPI00286E1763|nr:ATP-binding protein [Gemmatimonas sp.]